MKKLVLIALLLLPSGVISYAQTIDTLALFEEAIKQYTDSIESTLTYERGEIKLQDGLATLHTPDGYKYLNAEQSDYVLTELWGNPKSETLGLLFPDSIGPLSDNFTYAVEITYSEDGYVEDEDAADIDYDDLLKEMQEEAEADNEARIKEGFDRITLVGWASEPFYDSENKKLHWAKELKFGDSDVNTLNYNIRVLGRKGYLNLNIIGDMDALPAVKNDINTILSSVEFNQGSTYFDFDPDVDDVAAYGIGGLIAGKALAKLGFFALIAKFWKIIAVGAVGVFAAFRKRFFGQKADNS